MEWWIISNINLFLIVLEELETKIKVPADLVPCEGPFLGYRWLSSPCVLTGWKGVRKLSGVSFKRALIESQGLHPYDLITFHLLHQQILSHWGLGFNIRILEEHRCSVCNRRQGRLY